MANRWIKRLLYRNKPAQIVQYAVVAFLKTFLNLVGTDAALIAGRFLGNVMWLLDGRHRRVALENLRAAMGRELDDPRLREIVRGVYEHIGMSVAEMMVTEKLFRERGIRRLVRIHNREKIDAALKNGRGAVVVLAHLGNWEIVAQAIILNGYRLTSVARPVDNPYLDRLLNGFRRSRGQIILFKKNALRHMGEALRENRLIAILADQDGKKNGIFVDFFGRKASTVRSPAVIALKYRAPIFVVNIWRDEMNRYLHHVEIPEPIMPEEFAGVEEGVAKLTALYTAKVEEYIRRHPSQWLWLHRRWKTRPPEESQQSQEPRVHAV